MIEQAGMIGQGVATATPQAVVEAARPRIGADRFRALADKLKKPAGVPEIALAKAPDIAPDIAPAFAPVLQVEQTEPAPVVVPPIFAVPEEPETYALPPAAIAIEPAPFVPPPPPIVVAPVEAAPLVPPPAPPPIVVAPVEAAPIQPVAVPAFTVPVFEVPAFTVPEPSIQAAPAPVPQTPLERILSSERKPVAPAFAVPEILPPPPPPPPPAPLLPLPVLVDENGQPIVLEVPSMEMVQERLREDATVRLQQLEIDNIWRQVLAHPTLEERADFLREAAAAMAAEQGIDPLSIAVAPEHDLSRIAEAAVLVPENQSAADADRISGRVDNTEESQLETAELARSLLDMMSSGSGSGLPHERALAADTLLRLLPKLATKSLQMLAQRLALMDNPPQLLVAKLIKDDRVEISGPLLEDGMHITDQDLAVVVAEDNPGKRRMIARRRRLSRATTDKLIATRDPSVLLTLVRNAGAEISHDGFIALTVAAAEMPDLMAPLSTRADLSAPNAFELFWPAPAQLRRYLLNRFLTDSETLTKILKITLSTKDGDDTRDTELPSAGEITELLGLACRGRIETAAQRLGEAINVDPAAVHRILLDREGEAMVVLLKTAGYPRSSVGDILPALKRGDVPLIDPERDVSELQIMFDTLSTNKARILITYWDWAVRKAGPYAPVH